MSLKQGLTILCFHNMLNVRILELTMRLTFWLCKGKSVRITIQGIEQEEICYLCRLLIYNIRYV